MTVALEARLIAGGILVGITVVRLIDPRSMAIGPSTVSTVFE
jgi:hypothetical protein